VDRGRRGPGGLRGVRVQPPSRRSCTLPLVSSAPTSTSGPLRLGIAGLGAVAQSVYLPLLARLPERFAIAAVCELAPSTRDAIGARYGLPPGARHASFGAMLEAGAIDAIVVLTTGSHAEVAALALESGIAVLCEKPLAYTRAAVDALEAVIARTGGRLLLGYMKLYDPAVAEAARVLREAGSELGALRAVEVTVLHPRSESQRAFAHLLPPAADVAPEARTDLRLRLDEDRSTALGPAAMELGELYTDILLGSVVHDLAVVRHLAGDPAAIDAVSLRAEGGWPPSLTISGRLAGGASLSIGWHLLPEYPAYREDVRFHHERGSVELTFPAPYRLHLPTRLEVTTGAGETLRRARTEAVEEAFEQQLFAFEALVREGRPPLAGVTEGRRDIVTCQAIAARLAAQRGLELGGEALTGIGQTLAGT
jgi:myo-inositol 2-dehydrogenase / D-chiro-inositol 1-dehydrogenase